MRPSTTPELIHDLHGSGFDRQTGRWQLAQQATVHLPAAAHERLLCLRIGRLWLTGPDADGRPHDVWLEAGGCAALPAGTEWLAGAEPEAGWVLLEGPDEAQRRRAALRLVSGFWATLARSAAAIARRAQGAISAGDSRASAGIVQ